MPNEKTGLGAFAAVYNVLVAASYAQDIISYRGEAQLG